MTLSEAYIAGMRGESYDAGMVSNEDMQTAVANTSPLGAWADPRVREMVGQEDTGCSGCNATARRTSNSSSQSTKSRMPVMGVGL